MRYILEAVPLSVFLVCIKQIDQTIPMAWQAPFLVSGILALVIILFLLYKNHLFNRILLGINLYLITGGLAFMTEQYWLNQIYGHLQSSGMLIWVILTGLATLIFSPSGFIGVPYCAEKPTVRKYSVYLFCMAVCAFIFSFAFKGSRLLSEIIPYTGLFIAQAALRRKCMGLSKTQPV